MAILASASSLVFYFSSAIGITLYNKWLYSKSNVKLSDCLNFILIFAAEYWGFHFPIALICAHMFTTFLFATITVFVCLKRCTDITMSPDWISQLTLRRFFTGFVPVGILSGCELVVVSAVDCCNAASTSR